MKREKERGHMLLFASASQCKERRPPTEEEKVFYGSEVAELLDCILSESHGGEHLFGSVIWPVAPRKT